MVKNSHVSTVYNTANSSAHFLKLLGYDINSNQKYNNARITKAADKFIFEAGEFEQIEYEYNPESDNP